MPIRPIYISLFSYYIITIILFYNSQFNLLYRKVTIPNFTSLRPASQKVQKLKTLIVMKNWKKKT